MPKKKKSAIIETQVTATSENVSQETIVPETNPPEVVASETKPVETPSTPEPPNATVQALREIAAEVVSKRRYRIVNKRTGRPQLPCKAESGESEVKIYRSNGDYVRTYTREVHGPNFKDLAQQFVKKQNDQLVEIVY